MRGPSRNPSKLELPSMAYSFNLIFELPVLRFLSVAALSLVGCATSPPWDVPTVYRIQDLDEDAKRAISDELQKGENKLGFQLISSSPELFEFSLNSIEDMIVLRDIQVRIQELSVSSRVPVVLQSASMEFASVSGRGRAEIELRGSATEGAVVLLDIGQPQAIEANAEGGAWSAIVTRSAKLSERGGWVYGQIRKGDAIQYVRINVLDPDSFEKILLNALPSDCVLPTDN